MRFLSDVLRYFVSITTGIVLIFIIILLMLGVEGLSVATLCEMPLVGLITAVITAFIHRGEVSGRRFALRIAVHYILICVTVSFFGVLFDWVSFTLGGILTIVISTAGVYVFTYTVSFLFSKKEADELNNAIKRKRAERT